MNRLWRCRGKGRVARGPPEPDTAQGRAYFLLRCARHHIAATGTRRAKGRVIESPEADASECAGVAHLAHGGLSQLGAHAFELDDERRVPVFVARIDDVAIVGN